MPKKKTDKKESGVKKVKPVKPDPIPVPVVSTEKEVASFLVDESGRFSFHFNATRPILKYPTQELIKNFDDDAITYTYFFSEKRVCAFKIKPSDIKSVKMINTGKIISLEIVPNEELPTIGTNNVEYELESAKIRHKKTDAAQAEDVAKKVTLIRNYLLKKMSLEKEASKR